MTSLTKEQALNLYNRTIKARARLLAANGVSVEDLEQIGRLAVCKAVAKLTHSYGEATFVWRWITSDMREYVKNNASTIRVPRNLFGKVRFEYVGLDSFDPSERESGKAYNPMDDAPPSFEDKVLHEHRNGDSFELSSDEREAVSLAIQALPPRERRAVQAFFFEGMTTAEIGTRHGVTRQAIEQNLARGLERLTKNKIIKEIKNSLN